MRRVYLLSVLAVVVACSVIALPGQRGPGTSVFSARIFVTTGSDIVSTTLHFDSDLKSVSIWGKGVERFAVDVSKTRSVTFSMNPDPKQTNQRKLTGPTELHLDANGKNPVFPDKGGYTGIPSVSCTYVSKDGRTFDTVALMRPDRRTK